MRISPTFWRRSAVTKVCPSDCDKGDLERPSNLPRIHHPLRCLSLFEVVIAPAVQVSLREDKFDVCPVSPNLKSVSFLTVFFQRELFSPQVLQRLPSSSFIFRDLFFVIPKVSPSQSDHQASLKALCNASIHKNFAGR